MKGGTRVGAGRPFATNPRTVAVMIRLTGAEAAALDEARGTLSRSAYLLRLLRDERPTQFTARTE